MKFLKKLAIFLLCIFLLGSTPVFASSDDTSTQPAGHAQLSDQEIIETYHVTQDLLDHFNRPEIRLGTVVGSTTEDVYHRIFPNAEIFYYNSYADVALALEQNKIDGFCTDMPLAKHIANNSDGLAVFGEEFEPLASNAYAIGKTEIGEKVLPEFNDYLDKIKLNGTFDKKLKFWLDSTDHQPVELPETGKNGVIRLAISPIAAPMTYLINGQAAGLEIDILADFAREAGYGVQVDNMDYAAVIAAISSARYDMACSFMTITKERMETMLFTNPYGSFGQLMIVPQTDTNTIFWEEIAKSFEQTFIRENRWQLILQGMLTTLEISFFSVIFGTLLGLLLCMLRRSRSKFLSRFVQIYVCIFQGTPILVILMILYYLVLAKTNLSGTLISIIAFSLNMGAYASEIFRSGLESVDAGQWDAALALGFTPRQSFFRLIFPQAARVFMPVYRSEIISLVKSTSIVGYVAVLDLTKMSDIIRSRTFTAFFPLITTAVVYFLISRFLIFLLGRLEKKFMERKRSRHIRVKEVEE